MTDVSSLGQIKNKSLRERVLDSLRSAIVSGELKPGQPLVETDLASQLGISRAPLREAINILNAEGLVETVPYHGTTVKKLARTDIEELYSLRSLLEGFAIQRILASEDVTDGVATLRRICDDMLKAAESANLPEVNRIDRRFHDALIELSGHSLLGMLWGTVALRVQQVMSLRNLRNDDIRQVVYNHIPIVDAIEAKASAEAIRLIHLHVGSAGDLIAEDWDSTGDNDAR